MVEVMVACVIFMILASGVYGILLASFKATNNDKVRVAASNLASRELEIVRQYFNSGTAAVNDVTDPAKATLTNYHPLPGGTQGQPLKVGGVNYTVVDSVAVQLLGPGASACDGGSGVAHPSYLLTATVTWPRMGATKPVVDQTVLTPPKGVVKDDLNGYVAIGVKNANGEAPAVSVPVQLSGPAGTLSQNTDSTGCAVFTVSTAGSYTASMSSSNWVDFYGNPAPSLANIPVTIGQLTTRQMTYDQAAEIDATFTTAAGYALPTTLPLITIANSGIQPTGTKVMSSTGAVTALKNLWPFPSGYTAWAGTCADADPAASGNPRIAPVVVAGNSVGAAQLALAPLDVTVLDNSGNPVVGVTVTASEQTVGQPLANCSTDANLTLGVTDASGHLATSLPNGSWQVAASGTSSGTFSVTGAPANAEVDLP